MKTIQFAVAAAALLFSTASPAQESRPSDQPTNEVADMCAATKCQLNQRVTLKDKEGGTFDRTFATLPGIAQPFGMIVLAGQTVYVEADVVDGKLTNLVAVDKVAMPAKTIIATLEQVDGKGMMLTVRNPFRQPLKFNMGIMPLDGERLRSTSSCPIGAGIQSFELWPYPVFEVVLGRGHLLNNDSKLACTE